MVSADADDQAAIGRIRNIVRIGFMDSSGMKWAPKVKFWGRPEPYLTAAMYRDGGAEEGQTTKNCGANRRISMAEKTRKSLLAQLY
jgi:hypothetical protein